MKKGLELAGQGSFPLRPVAHRQIATHTGIPAQYYDRMRDEAPDLLATNINAWFRLNESKRMVRTLGGDVRAFLSNRYQRIENEEIAEVALPVLKDIPGISIVSAQVTDSRLYIQATTDKIQGEVKKGDVVQAGVIISNSEVGLGSVSISPMIPRLVCLNGLVLPDSTFRAKHVGRRVDDNEALWADDTRKADDKAVLLKVRDMVRASVDQVRFGNTISQMQGLTADRITGNPEKAIEVLAKKIGATESERGGILRALIEGGDTSAWGLVNAVTAQAHSIESYDRGVDFERMGGQLIELPKTEWAEVLMAA